MPTTNLNDASTLTRAGRGRTRPAARSRDAPPTCDLEARVEDVVIEKLRDALALEGVEAVIERRG